MQGPNVRKLIATRMAKMAIPPSGGIADGVAFLMDKERIVSSAREATKWVEEAIAVIRTAPDNPYKDDEEIAGAILAEIESKRKENTNA